MQKKTIARLLPLGLCALASGSASAAGFQLLEQNASGIGNAFAGSAAVAENASTIYFNPAGMTQLAPRSFSVGLAAVRPSFEFSDKGSSGGALRGDGDDAGGWAAIPNAYLAWGLTKDLYAGVGVSAPFGLETDYNGDWVGAAQALSFEIRTVNVNPSLAWRINDKVSVGVGADWQRIDAKYKRRVGTIPAPVPLSASTATLDVDDDSWGWNAGVLFTLSPKMKVGLSYRSKIEHTLEGDLDVTGPSALVNGAGTSKAKADIELPDTFIVSVAQQLNERWEMLGDLSWTGWSSIKSVDIVRTSGASAGQTAQTLETDFRDTWRIALGANYKLDDAWKLKFGVAYDQTPVRDQSHRLVSLPDANRTWFSVGGQWQATKASAVDLGLAYIFVPDTKIDNDQTSANPLANRGRVTGEYDSSVWLFGAQYSMAF